MKYIKEIISSIIRVNHAGERAAVMIYEGQLDGCRDPEARDEIESMLANERSHLQYFTEKMRANYVRPTVLSPIWDFVSYSLGYITGRCGAYAMTQCTNAVETVISEHYKEQERELDCLGDEHREMRDKINQFRLEEESHIKHDPEGHKYGILSRTLMVGCKVAIFLSKRL